MGDKTFAPIVLFVYNRPEHTKKTVETLLKNKEAAESELYIFSDAAKNEKAEAMVQKTRAYIKTITGFKEIHITERSENFGLAKSVITGVTEVVNCHGRVIVLEDDLLTSPYFLEYMNAALEKYEEEKKVFSITGYSHFPNGNDKLPESYFLKVFSSWSWATWKDRWALFDADAKGWEKTKTDEKLRNAFDYEGCFDNSLMLKQHMEDHIINSWAIRAYWTMFTHDEMTLFSNRRLCENIGFDGTGVHCNTEGDYLTGKLLDHVVKEFPECVEETELSRNELIRYIREKKRAYKAGRIKYYLTHPHKAVGKIITKLKR